MTDPVISTLGRSLLILLEDCNCPYQVTPFGESALTCEAVKKITGLSAAQIGKAMVASVDGRPVIALIEGSSRLSVKNMKASLGAKKVVLLPPADVSRITGLIVGAVTPLIALERRDISVVVDPSLCKHSCMNISSGDPAFGVNVNPEQFTRLVGAQVAPIQEYTPSGPKTPKKD